MENNGEQNCIFCKIAGGEIPAEIAYEDEHFMAIVDIHPEAPGHVQVIPKHHYRWVWDVPNVGEYFEVVRTVAKAQQKAFGTDWIISKVVGEEVPHAHVWIFPGDAKGDKNDIEGNAERLRKALTNQ
ncbi:MAG: HIT domain-containing protein [Candidatus Paceibacterota bacterium]